jgi:hypothetical protein
MAHVNNLTNVYNQNPTLQSQYTLQQYLDLYGGSSAATTPTTATPYDPTMRHLRLILVKELSTRNTYYQFQGGG